MNSKMMLMIVIAASFVGLNSASASQNLKVEKVECVSVAGKNIVSVPSLKRAAKLTSHVVRGKEASIECQSIRWENQIFIAISYDTSETVTYTGRTRAVRYYDLFHNSDSGLNLKFYDPIENLTPVWSEFRGYLVMRTRGADDDGKPVFLNGYVYLPKKGKFVDYALYAMDNDWPLDP